MTSEGTAVQARQSFVTRLAGHRISVVKGELFDESDPVVKAAAGKFGPPKVRQSGVSAKEIAAANRAARAAAKAEAKAAEPEPATEPEPDTTSEEESPSADSDAGAEG